MTTPDRTGRRTDPTTDPQGALFAAGDAVRRSVLGDTHVDRSYANADAFIAHQHVANAQDKHLKSLLF